MNDLSHIPPTIQLLAEGNWGGCDSPKELFTRFQKLSKEIANQAEWTYENFEYFDDAEKDPTSLIITPAGGLNPFSSYDVCAELNCTINSALQMTRTVGLYANIITLPDIFSISLIENKKPTDEDLAWLVKYSLVLKMLYPLIQKGIIRFWSGRAASCSSCRTALDQKISERVTDLINEYENFIHTEVDNDSLSISTSGILESPLIHYRDLTKKDKYKLNHGTTIEQLAKSLYSEVIKDKITSNIFELQHSDRISSTMVSTSNSSLFALRSFDQDAPTINELATWENARSIQLPWVSELSPLQIVELRDKASGALEGFRNTFVKQLDNSNSNAQKIAERIDKLQYEAESVERELRALNLPKEGRFRNIAGSLGITISVYGFAAGFVPPAAALTGLLSLLGLVHKSSSHGAYQKERLITQPAYVLLKAKEILEHANQSYN